MSNVNVCDCINSEWSSLVRRRFCVNFITVSEANGRPTAEPRRFRCGDVRPLRHSHVAAVTRRLCGDDGGVTVILNHIFKSTVRACLHMW